MPSYLSDSNYRLGLTPQTTISLVNMQIAVPDQVVFRPASVYYPRSDFSRVGDGFASVDWVWDMISLGRLARLLEFLNGADSASVYVYTDRRTGIYYNPKTSFALFYATMWKPILSGEEGVHVAKSPYVVQTVKVQFVNMIEQTGYII